MRGIDVEVEMIGKVECVTSGCGGKRSLFIETKLLDLQLGSFLKGPGSKCCIGTIGEERLDSLSPYQDRPISLHDESIDTVWLRAHSANKQHVELSVFIQDRNCSVRFDFQEGILAGCRHFDR